MRAARHLRYCSVGLAWLLSLQAAVFTLQPGFAAAACCCAAREEHCRCPVCAHARLVADPHPSARSCGEPGSPARDPAPRPFLPPAFAAETRLERAPAHSTPPQLLDGNPQEVPTPPPLA